MRYCELLDRSEERFRTPLTWRLPGAGAAGKTTLYHGAALTVGEEARALGARHALLLIGSHVQKTEGGAAVCGALEEAGISYDIFSGIPAEPHYEVIQRLQDAMRSCGCDIVIGAGGGSVMDIAKLAAHAADGNLEEKLAKQDFFAPNLPLILLPTTSGTGSEVSPYSVLTVDGKKVFYFSPNLLPTIALVDPLLTVSAPPKTTAATAFDAMTHALEGAMVRPVPYAEALAVESTAQILHYVARAVHDGADLEARYYLALASVMGMMAYAVGGGLYAHSISYILTLERNQAHGVGCGFALPYTLAMNEAQILPLLDRLAARCFGSSGTEEARRAIIEQIQKQFIALGLPASLEALRYTKQDIPALAEKMLGQYFRKNNPRQISYDEAIKLFTAMYCGEICYF